MDQETFTIDQVRELADRYEGCGLGTFPAGKFLRNIATTGVMPHGGGVSWLNDLMRRGSPQTCMTRANEIEELAARSNRKDTAATLRDFASKIRCGKQLTERQEKLLKALETQVIEAKPDHEISERDRELIAGLRVHKMLGSFYYWGNRPATSNRLDAIFGRWTDEGLISYDDWEYLRSNFRSMVEEFESSKHLVGSLRWDCKPQREAVIVNSQPYFIDGNVHVDVICTRRGVIPLQVKHLRMRMGRQPMQS